MPNAVSVVHQDQDLLVLNKPSGLPTTTPRKDQACLVSIAKEMDDSPFLHPTSRLDAEVSGMVTFVRNPAANRRMMEARKRGTYKRLYVALAVSSECASQPASGSIDAPIAIDDRDPRRRVVSASHLTSKHAESWYRIALSDSPLSVLWLWPQTGRTHQLRVHAQHLKMPIFGDVHYGGVQRLPHSNGRLVSARRTMLHCIHLSLPGTHAPLSLQCLPPRDFMRTWSQSTDLELPSIPEG